MALRLNPLSTAKGKKFTCEMCGKAATLACQHCRVTYYCAREHQSVDWFGIHEKICQLLGALRTLRPTLGSEDERQRRNLTVQMSQHALIDLTRNEAQKQLVMGQYELAIPGALQSLRFSMEVYGSGRIELVPAYLLLAESNLGLKRYKVAEEFLLYANWSVLKNPDASNELKSQLYRNFGKLYASQGRFSDALKQLALDVYYSSLESGPEHIDTAGGLFYMADVFLTQGSVESALAFYDKVVDVWYKFLVNLRHRPEESIAEYLSESAIGEAVEMLRAILETRSKHLGATHIATGEAAYALGILKHVTGFDLDARAHYSQALGIYTAQLGADNESTIAIQRAIDDLPPVPQQLIIKHAAQSDAQRAVEESKREQERHEAILEQHSVVTHGHPHQPLGQADPTQQQPSEHSDPADAFEQQQPAPLSARLQDHLDALREHAAGQDETAESHDFAETEEAAPDQPADDADEAAEADDAEADDRDDQQHDDEEEQAPSDAEEQQEEAREEEEEAAPDGAEEPEEQAAAEQPIDDHE